MTYLLITLGSHGDVHPYIGMGMELLRRGHRVVLVTNAHFESLARGAGLEFEAMGSEKAFQDGIRNPDLWHPSRGWKLVFQWGALPWVRPVYDLVERYWRETNGEVALIASSLVLGARMAHDKLGVPFATVHLSPGIFRSNIDPPTLPNLPFLRYVPQGLRKHIWAGGDKYVIDPLLAPSINATRAELGMGPVSGIANEWWNSPMLVIGLFPEWFAPRVSDWPAQVVLTDFPMYDEADISPLAPELQQWLDEGEAPVAFTPGSAMIHGHDFFRVATDACVKLNRRGVLLTRHAQQIPKNLPPSVRHVAYAPFSTLLPRCAALVHHGGIGTTAQALRAGIAQLIMPMSHDQPDNAMRLRRLGVGDFVKPRAFRARRVAQKLDRLLTSPDVKASLQRLRSKFEQATGLAGTCDLIETRLRPAGTVQPV